MTQHPRPHGVDRGGALAVNTPGSCYVADDILNKTSRQLQEVKSTALKGIAGTGKSVVKDAL
jgi:hypothetical protein